MGDGPGSIQSIRCGRGGRRRSCPHAHRAQRADIQHGAARRQRRRGQATEDNNCGGENKRAGREDGDEPSGDWSGALAPIGPGGPLSVVRAGSFSLRRPSRHRCGLTAPVPCPLTTTIPRAEHYASRILLLLLVILLFLPSFKETVCPIPAPTASCWSASHSPSQSAHPRTALEGS